MATKAIFRGFPLESVAFLKDLSENNNKTWFAEHKGDFEKHLMEPARDFVYEMGNRIKEISPKVVADPKVDRSIFRMYRDTRFSKDKAPYKTHLGIFFWEGTRPKMDCPGYYFHLEPPNLMLAVGMHCFSKELLGRFRDRAVHPLHGPDLAKSAAEVTSVGNYEIGGQHYKKTPKRGPILNMKTRISCCITAFTRPGAKQAFPMNCTTRTSWITVSSGSRTWPRCTGGLSV